MLIVKVELMFHYISREQVDPLMYSQDHVLYSIKVWVTTTELRSRFRRYQALGLFWDIRHYDHPDQLHFGRHPQNSQWAMIVLCQLRDNWYLLGILAIVIIKFLLKLRQDVHTCVFYSFLLVLPSAYTPYPHGSLQILKTVISPELYLKSFWLNILTSSGYSLTLLQSYMLYSANTLLTFQLECTYRNKMWYFRTGCGWFKLEWERPSSSLLGHVLTTNQI